MSEQNNEQPAPRAVRFRRIVRRWLFEGLIVLLALAAIGWWQGRTLVTGPAPMLQSSTLDGDTYTLLQGNEPTLVYFWASWCPVCKLTGSNVDAVARDHRVITIAMQSGSAAELRVHLQERSLNFPVIVDEDGALAAAWGVRGVPTSFIIDGKGQIRFSTVGFTSKWGLRLRLWLAHWL